MQDYRIDEAVGDLDELDDQFELDRDLDAFDPEPDSDEDDNCSDYDDYED